MHSYTSLHSVLYRGRCSSTENCVQVESPLEKEHSCNIAVSSNQDGIRRSPKSNSSHRVKSCHWPGRLQVHLQSWIPPACQNRVLLNGPLAIELQPVFYSSLGPWFLLCYRVLKYACITFGKNDQESSRPQLSATFFFSSSHVGCTAI